MLTSLFFISCSENEEPKNEKPKEKTEVSVNNKPVKTLEPIEVPWMYLDDSLRNINRPMNFILPWMESDIKELPEKITAEISKLSPVNRFELLSDNKRTINDSLVVYSSFYRLDTCNCQVHRIYKGIRSNKDFSGYSITEQIICNALPSNTDLIGKQSLIECKLPADTTKEAEVHGHDH